jgi:CheY-like chemotaxis protein
MIKAVDLSELVDEMAHLLELSISKRAKLQYEFADKLSAVEVDVMQVRQIVMNLITNASDAIEKRGGRIVIRTGQAERTAEEIVSALLGEGTEAGRFVYFEVEDDGSGMDEETCRRMFDPFFTSKATGRGLGLAAVSGIVRGHRGAIEIRTTPGEGTLMRVLFPATTVEPERLDPEPESGSVPRGHGTILMVDDEESVRRLGRQLLERAGYEVLSASDGREAVELFHRNAERIRAVVLDMMMPVMNGDEAFRALKDLAPGLPVILSSGFNEQEAMGSFNGRGPAGFIQKPYRSAELEAILHRVLKD